MEFDRMLLPSRLKTVGIILIVLGIIFAIARFKFGYKPDFLTIKTFAVYSLLLKTKYMQIIDNNMAEELIGIFLLLGFFILAFSRDKNETEKSIALRVKTLFISTYITAAFLFASILFTYGFAFIYVLVLNLVLPLIIYILLFRISLFIGSK